MDIPKKGVVQKNESYGNVSGPWIWLQWANSYWSLSKQLDYIRRFYKKKLQGNTAATASTQPKFSVDEKPTKDPQEGENFPLGGRDEPEATKNTPAPSGDSKIKDQ